MFCIQCGSHNPDNATFCGVCGRDLEQRVTPSPAGPYNQPIRPVPEAPASGGAQSPAGEYIPMMQETPPASGFPASQGTPPIQGIAQTGYGIPQNYPPPSSPYYSPSEPAVPSPFQSQPPQASQPWAPNRPISDPGQPPLLFTNQQVGQTPPTYPTSDQYGSAGMFNAPGPAYTGQPSSAGEMYPTIPQMQPSQPGQEFYSYTGPGVSPTPTPPPSVRVPWYKAPPKPMPLWAFIGIIVAVVVLLVVLQVTGSDWAAGATRVGIVAGILAAVVLLATVVRILLGMAAKANPRRVIQLISAGLSILLLALLCLVGLTQQSAIHGLQAHSWEGQRQWQSSINEFQLAGEGAPMSENIARIYNEWGEQFSAQQHYQEALAKFSMVVNNYGSASTGVARAQSSTIKAYLGWGQQASQQHDYTSATSHYDALLQLSYCTTSCQSQASALDATAYYNLAEGQLAAQNYSDAANNFQTVVSRFASSPEAQKLHEDFAKALFGHGKEQIASATCSSAVPTYQQLSTQFKDTPEGQQATTALKAPQAVKGHFTSQVPKNPSLLVVAALMHGLYPNYPSDQFQRMFYSSPGTIIRSDGTFVFKPVSQGTYDLAWGTISSVTGNGLIQYVRDDGTVYAFTVGSLCTYDLGDISYSIPVVQ